MAVVKLILIPNLKNKNIMIVKINSLDKDFINFSKLICMEPIFII